MSRPRMPRRFALAVGAATSVVMLGMPTASAVGPNAQETVNTSQTATEVAQQLVGPGVSVSNVTYSGDATAKGSFSFVDPTVVGFGQGVVLSSGNADDAVGPNVSESTSTDFAGAGDADLSGLSGFTTYDASVLEFDFVPTASQVVFQYAFASDEYTEWVNTPYNDVFAFFVNGSNCATERQVAGDPAAPFVPVAINNINNGNPLYPDFVAQRPDLFRDNGFDPPAATPIDLELDGITRVLTCRAAVNPGTTNHMKLAIADSSDGVYDSTVFIQAGSLVSNENPVADLSLLPQEGAAPLAVTAAIEGEDPNGLPLTYSINWGDGTAPSTGALPDETAIEHHTYLYGGDYTATLTVSNGTLVGTSSEDVHVTGGPPPGGTCGTGPHRINISDASIVEGNSGANRKLQFKVTLSEPAMAEVDVSYSIQEDSATYPDDIVSKVDVLRTLRFRPSSKGVTPTVKTVTVPIRPDTVVEGDETLTVELSDPSPGYTVARGVGVGTIIDGGAGGAQRVSLSPTGDVCEGEAGTAKAVLQVTLAEPLASDGTVLVDVTGGDAVAGKTAPADIKLRKTPILVKFKAGQVQKTLTTTVFSNLLSQPDRTVAYSIVSAPVPIDGSATTGIVTIRDDG